MKRVAPLALALALGLSACGGSSSSSPKTSPTVDSLAGSGDCTPSGTGSTDLTKEPTYTVPSAAELATPPTTTTNTDIVCGTGDPAVAGSAVTVQYVGVDWKTGKVFDASWTSGQAFPFTIGSGVIEGFSKGVTGMKVGGRRLIVIPPAEGYGNAGPVPGGTLAFIIDLVKIG